MKFEGPFFVKNYAEKTLDNRSVVKGRDRSDDNVKVSSVFERGKQNS